MPVPVLLPASRGGSSAHSKNWQLSPSGCPHRRNKRPLFADSFFTVNSTDGLPQRQFIGGAEGFGSVAGADRGAVWGAAREVDVDGGREGGGGRGGGFGPGAGAGARFTGGGGSTAPQSAGSSE
jgi:hypothetical protein